jgi:DNA-binding protein YbaB
MAQPAAGSPFGGSRELQAMYDEIVGVCEAIAPGSEASAPIGGFDATRMVKITLDAGGRVHAVSVDASWRTRLGAKTLGAAIIEAVQDAAVGRLRAWGEAVAGDSTPATPDSGVVGRARPARKTRQFPPRPPKTPTSLGDPTAPEPQNLVAELSSLVDGLSHALSDLERVVGERAAQQVVGRSADGMVAVTLRGGTPVSVELDGRWLARADATDVSRRVKQAFDAAYAAHGRLTLTAFAGDGPLGRLLELGSDPESLMRRLGLTE